MIRSKSVIAIPPGATIKEQLEDRKMTQKEFAIRMGMSEKHISKLINGEVKLTNDVALKLEFVLGIPAMFWNNLESRYREKIAEVESENQMDEDIEIAKKIPYNEMAKNGWVPVVNKAVEKVCNLRKFFGVANLDILKNPYIQSIACRRLGDGEKADYALYAWAQCAKNEAADIVTDAINIDKLNKNMKNLRKMTTLTPEVFSDKLVELLSQCGIALVFLPHIGGSFLHGATFYSGDKIVIGLTLRGRDADRFWFSLFHEIGHIVLGHIGQPEGTSKEDESAADEFARNILINNDKFDEFVNERDFSRDAILKFSKNIDIAPGIVVGRLQKERYIDYSWYHDLKEQYTLI